MDLTDESAPHGTSRHRDEGAHRTGVENGTGLDRRELLKRGAIIGAAVALPWGTAVGDAFAAAGLTASQSALTPSQSTTLAAILERLIPGDAHGPGAKAAGVTGFVERELLGGLAGGLSAAMPLYAVGLPAVDAYAQSAYGGSFVSLSAAQQDAVLVDVESGKAPGFAPDSATFFQVVREHAVEAMFADPVYGGNKNFAGWNLLGYAGVQMPVTAAQQKLGVIKRTHAPRSTYADGAFAKARKQAVGR